jgi:hypothetical protein
MALRNLIFFLVRGEISERDGRKRHLAAVTFDISHRERFRGESEDDDI